MSIIIFRFFEVFSETCFRQNKAACGGTGGYIQQRSWRSAIYLILRFYSCGGMVSKPTCSSSSWERGCAWCRYDMPRMLPYQVAGTGQTEQDGLSFAGLLALERFVDCGADGVAGFRSRKNGLYLGELNCCVKYVGLLDRNRLHIPSWYSLERIGLMPW